MAEPSENNIKSNEKFYFLIVEDEKELREAIIDILPDFSDLNVEIIQAANGKLALELIHSHHPIAIMSDIGMPVMNGLDLLNEIRNQGIDTPFMVVSAFGDKSNTVKALRMGAFDFLDKPFTQNHLIESVTNLIHLGLEYHKIVIEIQQELSENKITAEESVKKIKTKKLKAIMMRQLNKQTG